MSEVTVEGFRRRAIELLEPPVVYVPIRHHSPACSLHLPPLIERLAPFAVLVEGPPSFDDQIDLLLDPDARMPLAIYSYASFRSPLIDVGATGEPGEPGEPAPPVRTGSYFPVCDYSPELVALRAGRSVGAELGFIDLDADAFARFAGRSVAGHTDEQMYSFSATLIEVAARLGCRDHNELWDQMVEGAAGSVQETVASVLAYGALARDEASVERLLADGTIAREASMARLVVEALGRRDAAGSTAPIIVVTGAYHTVVLPELVDRVLAGETLDVSPDVQAALPEVAPELELLESGHGLLRYSFDRLDALSGYGAGMPSPAWYQMVWEQSQDSAGAGDRSRSARRVIGDVGHKLRQETRDGQPSLPSIVDAFVACEQLAALRNRPSPTRCDIVDAMVSCFTKGEDSDRNPVRRTAAELMTGFDLGAVPPGTPRVPLAKDFDSMLKSLGLPAETSETKQVNLDVYRSERDRERSRFLHGLTAIGVNYGRCITPLRYSRARGRDVIRERWTIRLSGSTDATLTEAAIWGASITEAVRAKTLIEVRALLETQPDSAELMGAVMNAAQRGVHEAVAITLDELRSRIAVDPGLHPVVAALTEAELLWTAREPLGGGALDALPEIAEQLYTRACHLGRQLHLAPKEEQRALVADLGLLHRVLTTTAWDGLDEDLFWTMLAEQRSRVDPGRLRGAIGGLEWRGGRVTDEELVALVGGHIHPSAEASIGAEFLAGVVEVARNALWEIEALVTLLSETLGSYDEHDFLRRVPGLRSALASLTPQQTDRLAEAVQRDTGVRANVRVSGASESDVLRHSKFSVDAREQLEADGLGHWFDDPVTTS